SAWQRFRWRWRWSRSRDGGCELLEASGKVVRLLQEWRMPAIELRQDVLLQAPDGRQTHPERNDLIAPGPRDPDRDVQAFRDVPQIGVRLAETGPGLAQQRRMSPAGTNDA